MKNRSSRTGGNAPKLFLLLFAFLLGAFVAAPWPAVDGVHRFEHLEAEFPRRMAMHFEKDGPRQIPQKPAVLVMRVAQWRLWHKLFKRDLLRLDNNSPTSAVVRMTCRAYGISFRGRSRFEDTKERVRACLARALTFLKKKGFENFSDRVYEVEEKHVNRLLKFAAAADNRSSSSALTIVDTIDFVAVPARTTFFYFCQQTTPWDKKTSKCLGASEMNYNADLVSQYDTQRQIFGADYAALEWDMSEFAEQDGGWTQAASQSGDVELLLVKPLKAITEEPLVTPNIIFIDLVEDEKPKWWFTVKTEKAAEGGKIVTVSCNTDIEPGWPSRHRKEKWRKRKTFSGLDMNHANWCLSKVSMQFQDKATHVYVASSHIATLQGLFRQFKEKGDEKTYRCILKDQVDAKLSAKLDAALWQSYLQVPKKPWKVVKYQYGSDQGADHCTGYFEIEFSPQLWSMTYLRDIGEKEWKRQQGMWGHNDGLLRLDLKTGLPAVHAITTADSWQEELLLPRTTLITLERQGQSALMLPSDEHLVEPSPSSENCEASLDISANGDVEKWEIFPDPTEYDIRSTQIFKAPHGEVDV